MSDNILAFPGKPSRHIGPGRRPGAGGARKPHRRSDKSYHTVAFRSKEAIMEADEAILISDVCYDVDMAQRKLEKIRERTVSLTEYTNSELTLLEGAESKLAAAIVAALLSRKA